MHTSTTNTRDLNRMTVSRFISFFLQSPSITSMTIKGHEIIIIITCKIKRSHRSLVSCLRTPIAQNNNQTDKQTLYQKIINKMYCNIVHVIFQYCVCFNGCKLFLLFRCFTDAVYNSMQNAKLQLSYMMFMYKCTFV